MIPVMTTLQMKRLKSLHLQRMDSKRLKILRSQLEKMTIWLCTVMMKIVKMMSLKKCMMNLKERLHSAVKTAGEFIVSMMPIIPLYPVLTVYCINFIPDALNQKFK